ncbi:hypothetical protein MUN89_15770 [Halobacillus salinarum]|uniref:Uncharacterized protein n=1 Tax=Halobacillus salinarum TaxID=2932257 RepID=A0ABY4EHK6_9BACI|nr:hypothetical protein [Halobacillus salinarum]UOQ43368.1 hypothetical protein MUN89_15770 [Halobacillus salinarum]
MNKNEIYEALPLEVLAMFYFNVRFKAEVEGRIEDLDEAMILIEEVAKERNLLPEELYINGKIYFEEALGHS